MSGSGKVPEAPVTATFSHLFSLPPEAGEVSFLPVG